MVLVSTADNSTINRSERDYKLTRCPKDNSLCCGAPGTPEAGECCNQGRGVYLDNLTILTTKPTASSYSVAPTASPSATPTTSASSSSSSATPSPGNKSNTGAIVGAVVGAIGGIAIFGLAIWLLRRHKKRDEKPIDEVHETVIVPEKYQMRGELPFDNYRHHGELHGHSIGPAEMEVPDKK
jgi:hypothetical protein